MFRKFLNYSLFLLFFTTILTADTSDVKVLWKYKTGHYIVNGVTIDNNMLYVGSGDTNLYAFDLTKKPNSSGILSPKWIFTNPTLQIVSKPAVLNGVVYFPANDGYLYAVNSSYGNEKWRRYLGNESLKGEHHESSNSTPAIRNNTLYVGSSDGNLYSINTDGTINWKFQTDSAIVNSPAIGKDGTIYIASYDSYLYAVTPKGEEKWKISLGSATMSSPTIFDGEDGEIIYIGSNDYNLYAIKSDGTLKWKYATANVIQAQPAVDSEGTIYVGSLDKTFYAINKDGTLKWKSEVAKGYITKGATVKDGIVYFTSDDWKLYALNIKDGSLQWSFMSNAPMQAPPTIDKGVIYVGSQDDYIYAIQLPKSQNIITSDFITKLFVVIYQNISIDDFNYWINREKENPNCSDENLTKAMLEKKGLYKDTEFEKFINNNRFFDANSKAKLSDTNLSKEKFLISLLNSSNSDSVEGKLLNNFVEITKYYTSKKFNNKKLASIITDKLNNNVSVSEIKEILDNQIFQLPIKVVNSDDWFIATFPEHNSTDYNGGFMTKKGSKGIEFALKNFKLLNQGVDVLASKKGVVEDINISNDKSCSSEVKNYIKIKHNDNTFAYYGYVKNSTLQKGDSVNVGQKIGEVDGCKNYPILYFEVRDENKQTIDIFKKSYPENSYPPAFEKYPTSLNILDFGATSIKNYDKNISFFNEPTKEKVFNDEFFFWVKTIRLGVDDNITIQIDKYSDGNYTNFIGSEQNLSFSLRDNSSYSKVGEPYYLIKIANPNLETDSSDIYYRAKLYINSKEKKHYDFSIPKSKKISEGVIISKKEKEIIELYVATFKRAPDKDGFDNWYNEMVNNGWTMERVAEAFYLSEETQLVYKDANTTELFIKKVYNNVLNRDPDSAGLEYWKKEIDSGRVPKHKFIIAVINAAEENQGDDKLLLENKTKISVYFTITKGLSDPIKAKEILKNITKDPNSVEEAKKLID